MADIAKIIEEYKQAKDKLKVIEQKTNLMVERNIQQTSSGTLFVTLPKAWGNKLGITKGRKVMIVWTKDDALTIVP